MSQAYTNFVKGVLIGLKTVYVTCPFGKVDFMVGTTHVTWHNGIDMVPAVKAMAIERGKVTDVGYNSVEGNYIVLQHGDYTESLYKQLAPGSICVKVYQIVERGLTIATAGHTGTVTGAHMHLGIRIKGVFVDPMPYLLGTKAITPYEEIRMNRPTLPTFTVLVPELYYRDKPNGTRIKFLEMRYYPYIGKSQPLGGYEWAEILLDDGSHVFCGINSKWNTVKFIEPTTITIDKIIYKPLIAALEQDGMLINLSIVSKEK